MRRSLAWEKATILAVDQCALPHDYRELRLRTVDEVIDAIKRLAIRGAPAIGVAGALAVALSAEQNTTDGVCDEIAVRADARRIAEARPTAVNLSWAVERVLGHLSGGASAVLAEAQRILAEDEDRNRAAADHAAELVLRLCGDRPLRLLTHCNTGRLATVAWGTALGTIRALHERGRVTEVLFGETRPLLQGARLTAWELAEAGIPHRMMVDSAGPAALANGLVDAVLVGADRVCANGDVANKIGTYSLALAAKAAGVPFIVVAPVSTLDPTLLSGADIEIEQRSAAEVTTLGDSLIAPSGTPAYNPAFDVTPAALITAVVTEDGVHQPSGHGLAEITAQLYARGWMEGTAGNVSVRVDADTALITASGVSKGSMTDQDVVRVRIADSTAVGAGRPSAETSIHTAVYAAFPEVGAVVHAHPPYATAVAALAARSGADAVEFAGLEIIKGLGLADAVAVPVFENHASVPRIAADVAARLAAGDPPVLLIGAHGATAWGPTLESARNRMESLETLCRLRLLIDRPV